MDETIVVSPVGLRCVSEEPPSPSPYVSTPRTAMKMMRRKSKSRSNVNPTLWADGSPVRILPTSVISPAKELPDGLIKSPPASPPPSAWGVEETVPRRVRVQSSSLTPPRCDNESVDLIRHVCEVMLASPPIKLSNGHVTQQHSSDAHSDDTSVLKQRQVQRMQQLQFEHPSLNATPQRLAGASRGLREILNANATNVLFTPKPPPKGSVCPSH